MHVRGIRKKLYLAGITVALLSGGVAGAAGTAEAAETAVAEVQEAEAAEDVQDTADAADAQDTVDVTDAADVQDIADVTDVADVQDTADVTDVADVQDIADVTDVADVQDTADVTGLTDVQNIADAADAAEVQDTADVQEEKNGWSQEGGVFYYYIDGEKVKNTVMEIEGDLYGFSSSGALYKNQLFVLYKSGKTLYYRAGSNGVLLRNAWDNTGSNKYYYGSDGAGVSGICKVEGTDYLFSDGMLLIAKAMTVDGVAYVGDTTGKPKKLSDGWTTVSGKKFYCLNGRLQERCLTEIDGKTYGFGDYGVMYDDETFGEWVSGEFVNYRAKKGGELYRGGWYKDETKTPAEYYYYRKDGSAVEGYEKIGDFYYIFDNRGCMCMDEVYQDDDDVYYVADSEGHAAKVTKKNGWVNAGEYSRYYMKDGKMVRDQFLEIDGKLYYFGFYGKLYMDQEFDLYGESSRRYYRAKKKGSLYVNEWAEVENYKYYYGADGLAAKGLTKIGKKTYYFDYTGKLLTSNLLSSPMITDDAGETWIISSKGEAKKAPKTGWVTFDGKTYYSQNGKLLKQTVQQIDGKYYGFNQNGARFTNCRFRWYGSYYRADKEGALLQNTWFKDEYYGESAEGASGLAVIKGKQYYFDDGKAVFSCYIAVSDDEKVLYHANKSGILSKVTKDGLYYDVDGYAYYLKGGKLLTGTWKKIGDDYYYFNSYSYGQTYEDYEDGKNYIFREDGTLMRNGWIHTSLYVYYAKGSGELLTGEQKIDKKWYLFNGLGEMYTGLRLVNGEYWLYGNDGARIGKAKGEGWNKIDGEWYYIKDGALLTGEQTIGKKTYLFNDSGRMLANYVDEDNRRIYGADGALVKSGWAEADGSWYYVDPSTGQYVEDKIITIKGKDYKFGYFGRLQTGTFIEDSVVYTTDANGAIKKKTGLKIGWNLVDGYYKYVAPNGDTFYTGWVGDYYVSSGYLETNSIVEDKYMVDSDGRWVKKQGWYQLIPAYEKYYYHELPEYAKKYGLTWEQMFPYFYVKKNGEIAKEEWIQVGKDWYYITAAGTRATGILTIDRNTYMFDENGKYLKTLKKPEEGWYQYQDQWVYLVNGSSISGEFVEYGKRYLLKNGMVANAVAWPTSYYSELYGDGYYYGKNGAADLTKRGWQKIGGKWFYFRKNGRAAGGWLMLGKKTYYIDYNNGMVTGTQIIKGQLYTFDKNGVLTGQAVKTNGWYEGKDGWYYFQDGTLTRESTMYIGGEFYAFSSGKLVTDQFAGQCYMDKNGKRVKKKWKEINGNWFYFDADGYYVTGQQTIGGKKYTFNEYGELV